MTSKRRKSVGTRKAGVGDAAAIAREIDRARFRYSADDDEAALDSATERMSAALDDMLRAPADNSPSGRQQLGHLALAYVRRFEDSDVIDGEQAAMMRRLAHAVLAHVPAPATSTQAGG